eukprot:scaffold21988_cov53-Attheya_sp.AAC.5
MVRFSVVQHSYVASSPGLSVAFEVDQRPYGTQGLNFAEFNFAGTSFLRRLSQVPKLDLGYTVGRHRSSDSVPIHYALLSLDLTERRLLLVSLPVAYWYRWYGRLPCGSLSLERGYDAARAHY